MPPSELLNSFLKGNAPRNLRLAVARGAAPLPLGELLQILVRLADDADPDVAREAGSTIRNLSEDEVLAQLQARDCSTAVLGFFARESELHPLLEAIILNPATPAEHVEAMAARVPEQLMDTILYNRTRILERPGILAQLKLNSALTPAIDAVIREIEVEFFGSKKQDYSVAAHDEEEQSEAGPGEEPAAETVQTKETELIAESEDIPDDLLLEGLPLDPQEREIALGERLSKMTVPQKLRFAMHGNREARTVLIRDPNKEVARAVLKSPKLSEAEIQAFAAMRNLPDELLRVIGESRQWTRNYAVVQNLVKNPKTPPLTAMHLISRLHSKDLTNLSRDRAVSEAVRRNAHRMLTQRTSRGTPS